MKTTEKRRHIFGTIAFILAFALPAIPLMHMPVGAAELGSEVIDGLISDSVDWLLHTHFYSDSSYVSGGTNYGTCDTLKDHIDPNQQIEIKYDILTPHEFDSAVSVTFHYYRVTYHNWNSFEDMYSEARKIFCGEWVERSVHSIAGQQEELRSTFYKAYNHFVEKNGSLYVFWKAGDRYTPDPCFARLTGTRYELLGKESTIGYDEEEFEALKPYVNAHLYPYHWYVYKDAKVADKYLYKVAEANDTRALVEVIMFDELAVRNQAFKATLELSNTADGWRIAGGTLIEALYDGKILTKISEDEYLAFLADIGREEINPPRVSPDTEDASGARVAFLAATTVLAAVIPAAVIVGSKKRKGTF